MGPGNPANDMDAQAVNSIICPQCEATLDPRDELCPVCGAATRNEANDPEPDSNSSPSFSDRLPRHPWVLAILLLHLGVFGIPIYWKTKHSTNVRIMIVLVSIAYTIFFAVVVYWGIMQIVELFRSMTG